MTDITVADLFEPASHAQWLKLVDKVLKGGDFEKRLVTRTADGVRIAPLYTRVDALTGADRLRPERPPSRAGPVGSGIRTDGRSGSFTPSPIPPKPTLPSLKTSPAASRPSRSG